jgi:hypothetical protein
VRWIVTGSAIAQSNNEHDAPLEISWPNSNEYSHFS